MNIFDAPTELWRAMCEKADHPLALVNTRNEFLWVNASYELLVGYSVAELVGKTWMSITVQNDIGGDLASVEAILQGKAELYRMSKSYRHKRGFDVQVELKVRRFPETLLEPIACFIVEAPPARATRPELDELEQQVSLLQRKFVEMADSVKRGGSINVHTGDTISNGDKTGRDKNSDRSIRVICGVLVSIVVALVWMFYYISTLNKPNVEPTPPPAITRDLE